MTTSADQRCRYAFYCWYTLPCQGKTMYFNLQTDCCNNGLNFFPAWSIICRRHIIRLHHWFQIVVKLLPFWLAKLQKFLWWHLSTEKIWFVTYQMPLKEGSTFWINLIASSGAILSCAGTGFSINRWCSGFHWHISYSWEGIIIWHSSCNFSIFLQLFFKSVLIFDVLDSKIVK